ncbi:hypothetical protein L7F22_004239 [Adiantum nelumboides]|nr:hypothetical protein [Adiantum nelumboides]
MLLYNYIPQLQVIEKVPLGHFHEENIGKRTSIMWQRTSGTETNTLPFQAQVLLRGQALYGRRKISTRQPLSVIVCSLGNAYMRRRRQEFDVHAKVIGNAAGPFCDAIRQMAGESSNSLITPSSGVHVILPDYYSPNGMGLIVPKTKDERVVFMLLWLGRTLAGTTDSSTTITILPEPHEDEIQFILDAISDYLCVKVRVTDVHSAWSGIRPLASDLSLTNTANISREHILCEWPEGLVTIAGGKWTTYRSMAEDAVNLAIKVGSLTPTNGCITKDLALCGGSNWDPAFFTLLAQQFVHMKKTQSGKVFPGAMETSVAQHLSHSYGSLAQRVAIIAQEERHADGMPQMRANVDSLSLSLSCANVFSTCPNTSIQGDLCKQGHVFPSVLHASPWCVHGGARPCLRQLGASVSLVMGELSLDGGADERAELAALWYGCDLSV